MIQSVLQSAIKRALNIVKLIIKGYDDKKIAEELNCTEDEVKEIRKEFYK